MKKFPIVTLVVLMLVIVACGRSGQPSGAPRSPFIGGSQGLILKFEKDSPPPEVTDSNFPFRVILNVKNDGETEVRNDQINVDLSGFAPNDFSILDKDLLDPIFLVDQNLLPKSRDPDGQISEGTTTFVTIPPLSSGESFRARPVVGNTPFTFQANVCYPYQTRATTKICVLSDLVNIDDNPLCNPNSGKTIFNSGSPVQVSNFKQHVVGYDRNDNTDVIRVSFDVSHRGQGDIYKVGDPGSEHSPGECPRSETSKRLQSEDIVHVTVNPRLQTGSVLRSVLCSLEDEHGEGDIRLIGGSRPVSCTLKLNTDRTSDFEAIFDIELDFNYDQSIKTEVLVKHFGIN
tara:strand:+ start:18952 stop:19986 length:1035 start_codon:yes stop_codon:yes gene_type:complete